MSIIWSRTTRGSVTTVCDADPLFHLVATSEVAAEARVLAQKSMLTSNPGYAAPVGGIRDWFLISFCFSHKEEMDAHIS